jgi:hypothetical protein
VTNGSGCGSGRPKSIPSYGSPTLVHTTGLPWTSDFIVKRKLLSI